MKLKEGLVLEEIRGRYVLIQLGKRWRPDRKILAVTDRAAYLWDYIRNREFEKEELIQMMLSRFADTARERAEREIEQLLKELETVGALEMRDTVKNGKGDDVI